MATGTIAWGQASPAAVQTKPEQDTAVAEFRRTVEAGPLFAAMARGLGKAADPKVQADEDGVTLVYSFGGGGHLTAKSNPAIEHWEQTAELPGLSRGRALRLLKVAAKTAFGEGGCGLDWSKSEEQVGDGGEHALVFRGDGCNCQARILMRGKAILGLGLSSSC